MGKEFWVDHVERAHQSSCPSSGSTCTGHEGSLFYQKVVCILQNHKAPASGVCVLQSKRQAQAETRISIARSRRICHSWSLSGLRAGGGKSAALARVGHIVQQRQEPLGSSAVQLSRIPRPGAWWMVQQRRYEAEMRDEGPDQFDRRMMIKCPS